MTKCKLTTIEIDKLVTEICEERGEIRKEQLENELRDLKSSTLGEADSLLADVNGRAKAHSLDAYDAYNVARACEGELEDRGVAKKRRTGVQVLHYPGGKHLPAAYKNRFKSTVIYLRRFSDGWRLLDAEQVNGYSGQAARTEYNIPPAARDDIVRVAMRGMTVRE